MYNMCPFILTYVYIARNTYILVNYCEYWHLPIGGAVFHLCGLGVELACRMNIWGAEQWNDLVHPHWAWGGEKNLNFQHFPFPVSPWYLIYFTYTTT